MLSTLSRSLLLAGLLCARVNATCDKAVCFNSFYGECGQDNDGSGRCTFNERNSYDITYPGNNGGHKLVFSSEWYTVSWIGDRLDDYPVRLAWHAIDANQRKFGVGGADSFKDMIWDRNITREGKRSQVIDFVREAEASLPNNHTKMTGYEALFYAGAYYTRLSISQPENPDYSEDDVYWSDTFYVSSTSMKDFLEAEHTRGHYEEKKKWRIGVGVGVGVGVPVLFALLIFQMCRMRSESKHEGTTSKKVTEE